MLLTQPRVALLHVSLTVMQAGWITPFVLLLYPSAGSPGAVLALVTGVLLAWMLTLELLSRRLESPAYDGVSLLLMFVTSLVLMRLLLYGGGRPWDLSWLARAAADTINARGGLPPVLVVFGANLLVWQRATAATSRDLSFFGVGVTFRLGMLLLFLGGGLYAILRGAELTGFLWVYFAAGLLGVSLARIGEKAVESQSAGAVLPPRRISQVLAAVGVTIGLGMLASLAYTPDGVRRFLRLFAPLWELVSPLFLAFLVALTRLLEPVALWLEELITGMMRVPAEGGEEAGPLATPGEATNPFANLPSWPLDLLRTGVAVLLIIGAMVGVLVFLLVYLERVRRDKARLEGEDEQRDPGSYGGEILSRGMAALRETVRLTRRLGLGRQLLAAISVQNIYANLSRIAGRHGRARRPAQPPDDYLPVLAGVFPGQEDALGRVTDAYMRVHYGDHPVGPGELAALREDYRSIRAAEVERR